nr:E3 ubiquitin-protein ligase ATL59 [Parasteatoda tepidariorum]
MEFFGKQLQFRKVTNLMKKGNKNDNAKLDKGDAVKGNNNSAAQFESELKESGNLLEEIQQLNWKKHQHKPTNLHCSVCFLDIATRETFSQIECGHAFHYWCIKTWLNQHSTCPVCRKAVKMLCIYSKVIKDYLKLTYC